MRILALDLGTRTGWALRNEEGMESGIQVFDVKRGESPGMRYYRFRAWLAEMSHVGTGLDLIVYEAAHQRGGAATEVAAGFTTRVQEHCARSQIEHASVHTGTLKRFATGKGNADKRAMVAAVARRWKSVTDDNEADAIALLQYALAELVPGAPRG